MTSSLSDIPQISLQSVISPYKLIRQTVNRSLTGYIYIPCDPQFRLLCNQGYSTPVIVLSESLACDISWILDLYWLTKILLSTKLKKNLHTLCSQGTYVLYMCNFVTACVPVIHSSFFRLAPIISRRYTQAIRRLPCQEGYICSLVQISYKLH